MIDSQFGTGESLYARLTFAKAYTLIARCDDADLDKASVLPSSADPETIYWMSLSHWYDTHGRLLGFWKLLSRACMSPLALGSAFDLMALACDVGKPWILQMFLSTRSYAAVGAIGLVSLAGGIAATQARCYTKLAGAQLRAGLASAVYERTLTSDNLALDAVTLIEVDATQVATFVSEMSPLWVTPLQIVAGLMSLGLLLGWRAGVAAAGGVVSSRYDY